MKAHTLAIIPGDGIGPEVIAEGLRLLDLIEKRGIARFHRVEYPIGADHFLQTGVALSDEHFHQMAQADAIYLGAVGDPRVKDPNYARDILLRLRFELDLYVNLRPVRLYVPELCPLKAPGPIDFTIVRENTEGVYVNVGGIFKQDTPDEITIQEEINTRKGVERIQRYAFELAQRNNLPLVMSDKANAMNLGHSLWQRVFKRLKADFSTLQAQHLYVDILAMKILTNPSDFGVIVTNNLFGDILADEAAGLIGGMGFAPSANLNPQTGQGLFEPVHGSAPDIAGQQKANPIAAILTLGLLLSHLGYPQVTQLIEAAVADFLQDGHRPFEHGGTLTTAQIGAMIGERLEPLLAGMPL